VITKFTFIHYWMHSYSLLSAQIFINEYISIHYWMHRYSLLYAHLFITDCTGIHYWMHRYLLVNTYLFITECTGFHYWVHRYSLVNAQVFITECTGIHYWMHRFSLLSAQVFISECTGIHYWVHRYLLVNAQLFITECTGIHIQQRTSATGTCTWQTTASISWMKGTSPTLAVMSVTDTSGMMTCLSIHRCIINYLRKLLYAFINPSVLCRPLTQKQKTIQCSNLEEQLHMTWVTDRFILRSFLDNTAWPISSISSKISAVTYVCVEICVAGQVAENAVGTPGQAGHLYQDNLEQDHWPCHQNCSQVLTSSALMITLFTLTLLALLLARLQPLQLIV